NFDVFADDDAGRHLRQLDQFQSGRAQDGAHDGIDTRQPPAGRQLLIDHRVDLALPFDHAAQDLGKVLLIGIDHTVAVAATAKSMLFELFDHLNEIRLGQIHLVERLDGCKPSLAAREVPAFVALALGRGHSRSSAKTRSKATSARQARTASAPLPLRPPAARWTAWASVPRVRLAWPGGMGWQTAFPIAQWLASVHPVA